MFLSGLLPLLAVAAIPTSSAAPCADGERVRFACPTKRGVARFCQTEAGLTYRFGPDAKPELTLDTTAVGFRPTGPDGQQVLFWARNPVKGEGMWRYTAVVDRTEDQFEGRVVVSKSGAAVATLPCTGPVQADLTELDALEKALAAAPSDLTAWIGRWERVGEDADLTLTQQDGGIHIQGVATLPIYQTVHVAELDGTAPVTGSEPPTTLTLETHCTVDLTWVNPGELRVSDTGNCGGHAVTFTGRYRRAF